MGDDREVYTRARVGDALMSWGWGSVLGLDDFIRELTANPERRSQLIECLLAAILSKLCDIKRDSDSIKFDLRDLSRYLQDESPRESVRDPMADAIRLVIWGGGADLMLDDCDVDGLSVRARKAIHRLRADGVTRFSGITREKCLELINCGISTWRELEGWMLAESRRLGGLESGKIP